MLCYLMSDGRGFICFAILGFFLSTFVYDDMMQMIMVFRVKVKFQVS